MRKKFLMLLICARGKINKLILFQSFSPLSTHPIFVLSILKSFLEKLLRNVLRLHRLSTDRRELQDREHQMRQIIVFRCARQHFLERLQLVFVLDLIERLNGWDFGVVESCDGILVRNAGVEQNAVVQGRLKVALVEV